MYAQDDCSSHGHRDKHNQRAVNKLIETGRVIETGTPHPCHITDSRFNWLKITETRIYICNNATINALSIPINFNIGTAK